MATSSSSNKSASLTAGQIIDSIRSGGGTVNSGTVSQYTGGNGGSSSSQQTTSPFGGGAGNIIGTNTQGQSGFYNPSTGTFIGRSGPQSVGSVNIANYQGTVPTYSGGGGGSSSPTQGGVVMQTPQGGVSYRATPQNLSQQQKLDMTKLNQATDNYGVAGQVKNFGIVETIKSPYYTAREKVGRVADIVYGKVVRNPLAKLKASKEENIQAQADLLRAGRIVPRNPNQMSGTIISDRIQPTTEAQLKDMAFNPAAQIVYGEKKNVAFNIEAGAVVDKISSEIKPTYESKANNLYNDYQNKVNNGELSVEKAQEYYKQDIKNLNAGLEKELQDKIKSDQRIVSLQDKYNADLKSFSNIAKAQTIALNIVPAVAMGFGTGAVLGLLPAGVTTAVNVAGGAVATIQIGNLANNYLKGKADLIDVGGAILSTAAFIGGAKFGAGIMASPKVDVVKLNEAIKTTNFKADISSIKQYQDIKELGLSESQKMQIINEINAGKRFDIVTLKPVNSAENLALINKQMPNLEIKALRVTDSAGNNARFYDISTIKSGVGLRTTRTDVLSAGRGTLNQETGIFESSTTSLIGRRKGFTLNEFNQPSVGEVSKFRNQGKVLKILKERDLLQLQNKPLTGFELNKIVQTLESSKGGVIKESASGRLRKLGTYTEIKLVGEQPVAKYRSFKESQYRSDVMKAFEMVNPNPKTIATSKTIEYDALGKDIRNILNVKGKGGNELYFKNGKLLGTEPFQIKGATAGKFYTRYGKGKGLYSNVEEPLNIKVTTTKEMTPLTFENVMKVPEVKPTPQSKQINKAIEDLSPATDNLDNLPKMVGGKGGVSMYGDLTTSKRFIDVDSLIGQRIDINAIRGGLKYQAQQISLDKLYSPKLVYGGQTIQIKQTKLEPSYGLMKQSLDVNKLFSNQKVINVNDYGIIKSTQLQNLAQVKLQNQVMPIVQQKVKPITMQQLQMRTTPLPIKPIDFLPFPVTGRNSLQVGETTRFNPNFRFAEKKPQYTASLGSALFGISKKIKVKNKDDINKIIDKLNQRTYSGVGFRPLISFELPKQKSNKKIYKGLKL